MADLLKDMKIQLEALGFTFGKKLKWQERDGSNFIEYEMIAPNVHPSGRVSFHHKSYLAFMETANNGAGPQIVHFKVWAAAGAESDSRDIGGFYTEAEMAAKAFADIIGHKIPDAA